MSKRLSTIQVSMAFQSLVGLILFSLSSYAQTEGTNGKTKVEIRLDYKDQLVQDLPTLKAVVEKLKQDNERIRQELLNTKNPCELDALHAEKLNNEFLLRNAARISFIQRELQESFRIQYANIQNLKSGNAPGLKNGHIAIKIKNETGQFESASISIAKLFDYILAYEANINSNTKSEDYQMVLKKLEYTYGITLSQAKEAFSNLNLYFDNLRSERIQQKFELASGPSPFKVVTTLRLGWIDELQVRIGSLSDPENSTSGLAFVRNFSDLFQQSNENWFWTTMQALQVTIDEVPDDGKAGLPVDGYLRRTILERMRGISCPNRFKYLQDQAVGPNIPAEARVPCPPAEMEILRATISRSWSSKTEISSQIRKGVYRDSFDSNVSLNQFLPGLSLGCGHVYFEAEVVCGCSERKLIKKDFKADRPLSFSCND